MEINQRDKNILMDARNIINDLLDALNEIGAIGLQTEGYFIDEDELNSIAYALDKLSE